MKDFLFLRPVFVDIVGLFVLWLSLVCPLVVCPVILFVSHFFLCFVLPTHILHFFFVRPQDIVSYRVLNQSLFMNEPDTCALHVETSP